MPVFYPIIGGGGGTDTSKDTVTADAMLEGITAHDASGEQIVGTIETYDGSAEEGAAKFQEKVANVNGEVTPDEGYVGLSKVTVDVPTGSAEFNIHYGTEAPEDTSKLWVETDTEPTETKVVKGITADTSLETLSETIPQIRTDMAAGVVGTKIYLFGGEAGSSDRRSTIYVYNTETNVIQKLSVTLPTAATGIAAGVIGTKVYLFGGYGDDGALNTINVFDTETNVIETLSVTLPTADANKSAGVIGTKIYLLSGTFDEYSIYVFDTETNTIEKLSASLPESQEYAPIGVVGTKIYVFGGATKSVIYVLNTETNDIEKLSTTLPTAAYEIAAGVIGTKVYLFGGYGSGNRLNTINVFDTETNVIETLSVTLPTAASEIAAGVIGTKVYLFGGWVGDSALNTINLFTSSSYLTENTAAVVPSLTENVFPLMDVVELGVSAVYIGNAGGLAEQVNAYLHNGTEWVLI